MYLLSTTSLEGSGMFRFVNSALSMNNKLNATSTFIFSALFVVILVKSPVVLIKSRKLCLRVFAVTVK